jgi:hypothetical protein
MENTLGKQALKLAMKIGLAGFALILWHAPAAKAQECCPDSYTAAEMAKMENSGKKPVQTAVSKNKQTRFELVAKLEPGAAAKTKFDRKENSNVPAKTVAIKQPVKTLEVKE